MNIRAWNPVDMTGLRFGQFSVIKFSHVKVRTYWVCKCDCGVSKIVAGTSLRTGNTKACGCSRKNPRKNIEKLREILNYDPDTGVFTWITSNSQRRAGEAAEWITSQGYSHIMINGKTYKAHRLAWLYMTGRWPPDQIDHIKHDNWWFNLREASRSPNAQNALPPASNTSGVKGVTWRNGKWEVGIRVRGKRYHVGHFDTLEAASAAYAAAAIRHFGEFARVTSTRRAA